MGELNPTKPLLCAFLMGILATALLLVSIQATKAIPRTIIVPDNYPTITAAMDYAANGDSIFVRSGTYSEHILEINKTLSLKGENAGNTKVFLRPTYTVTTIFTQTFSGYEDPIKIKANGVKLSGFTFITDGGKLSATGNETQIMNNSFVYFEGINVEGDNTTISDNGVSAGIQSIGSYGNITRNAFTNGFFCSGSYNIVSENRFNPPSPGSNFVGIFFGQFVVAGSHNKIIGNYIVGTSVGNGYLVQITGDHNMVYNNTVTESIGIVSSESVVAKNTLLNSQRGMIIGDVGAPTVVNTTIFGNNITGIGPNSSAGIRILFGENNTIYSNYIANNAKGISSSGNGFNNSVFLNDFINNILTADCFYFETPNYSPDNFDNGKEGNYYSDYTGTDANHDGFGDTPYSIQAVVYHYETDSTTNFTISDNHPLMKPFNTSTIDLPISSPSPTPSPTPIPITPTDSPSQPPSPKPLLPQHPTLSPQPELASPAYLFYGVAGVAVLVVVVAIALARRKRHSQ